LAGYNDYSKNPLGNVVWERSAINGKYRKN